MRMNGRTIDFLAIGANRNKNKFDDVLDPIYLAANTFFIEFSSGKILANSSLMPDDLKAAEDTIKILKLDTSSSQ